MDAYIHSTIAMLTRLNPFICRVMMLVQLLIKPKKAGKRGYRLKIYGLDHRGNGPPVYA